MTLRSAAVTRQALGARQPSSTIATKRSAYTARDGTGDCDIIHPQKAPETMRAVESIPLTGRKIS